MQNIKKGREIQTKLQKEIDRGFFFSLVVTGYLAMFVCRESC